MIELCVQHGLDDRATSRVWRIKPGVAITRPRRPSTASRWPSSTGARRSRAYADEIAQVFANADVIVGYNLSFDIDMLQAEYARIGKPPLDSGARRSSMRSGCGSSASRAACSTRTAGSSATSSRRRTARPPTSRRPAACSLACCKHFNLEGQDWDQIATVCDPQACELGRAVASPALGGRGHRARVRQAHGRPLHELAAVPTAASCAG